MVPCVAWLVNGANIQRKFSMVKHSRFAKIRENSEGFPPQIIWRMQYYLCAFIITTEALIIKYVLHNNRINSGFYLKIQTYVYVTWFWKILHVCMHFSAFQEIHIWNIQSIIVFLFLIVACKIYSNHEMYWTQSILLWLPYISRYVGGRGMEDGLPLSVYTADQVVWPEIATHCTMSQADVRWNRIGP